MEPGDEDVDAAAMAEAEAALQALAEEYPSYASADVDQMEAALLALQSAGGQGLGHVAALHDAAHNIKGQGAVFGYDLMTRLGEHICALSRGRDSLDVSSMASAGQMIAACRKVLAEKITGCGGAYGAQLSGRLGMSQQAA